MLKNIKAKRRVFYFREGGSYLGELNVLLPNASFMKVKIRQFATSMDVLYETAKALKFRSFMDFRIFIKFKSGQVILLFFSIF